MVGFLIGAVVTAIALLIISKVRPIGVEIDSPIKALIGGAVIGALSNLWDFLPSGLRSLAAVLSLGLVPLFVSIIIFGLAAWAVEGFRLRHGIWSAVLGAFSLAIVNSVLTLILRQFGLVSAD
ncbi:putative membrane protein [Rubidibacter lacunae KORDI 51-2]|uniref:Putative membrane protein n=1 Tax=Rubidibacter lacunae KORDI 51-2 TaxID=582515 RepID=U5D7P7_9CHRO|nr:phage holin family protein [Rubidibacter lacunae]ERN40628.1 putative membrane protein [Rubidibacter lacunae KORDI 51-2]